ncbi:MAG TPA: hypothetical protein VFH27_16080 [Longimicrobiaceae bacterium]|nr:hypothetical protein [Longimicrobiaceae bacterium]
MQKLDLATLQVDSFDTADSASASYGVQQYAILTPVGTHALCSEYTDCGCNSNVTVCPVTITVAA